MELECRCADPRFKTCAAPSAKTPEIIRYALGYASVKFQFSLADNCGSYFSIRFLRFLAVTPWKLKAVGGFDFSIIYCQEVIDSSSLSLSLPEILWACIISEVRFFHSRAAVKTLVRKKLLFLTNWPPRHHQPATDSALPALWESDIYTHEGAHGH